MGARVAYQRRGRARAGASEQESNETGNRDEGALATDSQRGEQQRSEKYQRGHESRRSRRRHAAKRGLEHHRPLARPGQHALHPLDDTAIRHGQTERRSRLCKCSSRDRTSYDGTISNLYGRILVGPALQNKAQPGIERCQKRHCCDADFGNPKISVVASTQVRSFVSQQDSLLLRVERPKHARRDNDLPRIAGKGIRDGILGRHDRQLAFVPWRGLSPASKSDMNLGYRFEADRDQRSDTKR
jgi:hypothetical protein